MEIKNNNYSTNFFFGIGIDRYQNVSPLSNAVKDLLDVVSLLTEKYNFDKKNVLCLTNEEATRSEIIEHLERYRDLVTPNDNLLIYYSGHGFVSTDKRGFWIPHDAIISKISSYLPNEQLRAYFRAIKSHHTLLITDSCFSGSLLVRDIVNSEVVADDLERRPSRWVFASGRDDEPVSDGAKGDNSPFAKAILSELKNNSKPKINIQKLGVNVIEITRSNYKQLPELCPLFESGHEGGEFIFKLKRPILTNPFEENEPKNENIPQLNDSFEWYIATQNNHIEDYREYIIKFSNGIFTNEAINKIIELSKKTTSSSKNIEPINSSTSKENIIFLFGNVNSGKSTVIASLLNYLIVNTKIKIKRDQSVGTLLSNYFVDVLHEKRFPSRTRVGNPEEIVIENIDMKSGLSNLVTFLEMSGEDLTAIKPSIGGNLPTYIDDYLNNDSNFIFALIIDVNEVDNDQLLLLMFIDYIVNNKSINNCDFILLITKWDTYTGDSSVESFIDKKLPLVKNKLLTLGKRLNFLNYSIGQVDYIDDMQHIVKFDDNFPANLWKALIPLVQNKNKDTIFEKLKKIFK